jgi:hypothetical protein
MTVIQVNPPVSLPPVIGEKLPTDFIALAYCLEHPEQAIIAGDRALLVFYLLLKQ